jgi:hypothetical protein
MILRSGRKKENLGSKISTDVGTKLMEGVHRLIGDDIM